MENLTAYVETYQTYLPLLRLSINKNLEALRSKEYGQAGLVHEIANHKAMMAQIDTKVNPKPKP